MAELFVMHSYFASALLSSAALLLAASAYGQTFTPFTIPDRSDLTGFQYLTQTDFATGTKYANTTIGGLSGIDYNPVTNTFISESDHAAAGEQTHYFTLAPVVTAGTPGYGVAFTGVTTLGPDDLESIRYDPSGNGIRVTAEGIPPHIYLYPASGPMSEWPVPANIAARAQVNSSFEGSTFTPNGSYFVSMENALIGDATDLTRITKFNKDGSVAGQYVYPIDTLPGIANPPQVIGSTNNGVSDLLALSDTKFLVIERAFNGVTAAPGVSSNSIRIYEIDVTGASDIQNVTTLTDGGAFTEVKKTLIFDSASLGAQLNTLTTKVDNIEGMSFGPKLPDGHDSFVLVNDNNYSNGQAKTQFLVFRVATVIPDVQYWDGSTPMADGKAGGGSGVWSADPTIENWARAGGLVNDQWNAHQAVFGTIGGTVQLDASAGPLLATGLSFTVGGYQLVGDALTPASPATPIEVVNANDTALIGSRITGAGGIVKTGLGTLVLTAANDVSGATTIAAGRLVLVDGGSLAASATTIAKAATLAVTGPGSSVASLANDGKVDIRGAGRFSAGRYSGGPGSVLRVALRDTVAGPVADRMVITGASGRTAIAVTNLAHHTGAYDPTGVPVVVSTGPRNATNASNFYLAGGAVQNGLFQYQLAYRPDPAFVLVSTPGRAAFQIATIPAATQQIWFDTLGLWLDRQADLRATLAAERADTLPAARPGSAAALAQDAVATSPTAPGVWARAVGSFASRGDGQNVSTLNLRNTFDVGYRQDTGGVYGGIDGTGRGMLTGNDALALGVTAGYLNSTQTFHGAGGVATYEGGSVGATATYYNNRFFLDALFKADVLSTRLGLSGLGKGPGITVTNYGGAVDAGYRLPLSASLFAEPLAALAYVGTDAGSVLLAGSSVGLSDSYALRGKLGGRLGSTMLVNDMMRLEAVGEAAYWDRLGGNAAIAIGGGGAGLTLADHQLNGYGEVGLGLSAVSRVNGLSGFVKADYRFATGYTAGTVTGGVRYAF